MKCFIAIEEDLLMEIWLLNPALLTPLSIPKAKPSYFRQANDYPSLDREKLSQTLSPSQKQQEGG
jgi:hypothetical protein